MSLLRRPPVLVACLVVGLAFAWFFSMLMRTRYVVAVPDALARRAFDRERAEATGLGMRLVEESDAPLRMDGSAGRWTHAIQLGARECVAVIATTKQYHVIGGLAITSQLAGAGALPSTAESTDQPVSGLVAHVQWCQPTAIPMVAMIETEPMDTQRSDWPGSVHYAIYRGTWEQVGGPSRLRRGRLSNDALRAFPAEIAFDPLATAIPAGSTALGERIAITMDGARLVPETAENFLALHRACAGPHRDLANPRVDLLRPLLIGSGRNRPRVIDPFVEDPNGLIDRLSLAPTLHDPVIDRGLNDFSRVLAVVDVNSLPSPCVALTFTRMQYGTRPRILVFDSPGTQGFRELTTESTVAVDTVCTQRNTRIYAVPDSDQQTYQFQAFAIPLPDAG